MSKARSTGNLNNSILISDTGAITFVSGSTTLASLSTTGQLSGSAPVLFAATSSFANSFTVAGTLTAQTLVVQTITSSVDFVTGSTRFGSTLSNTHVFSGSVTMNPGGLFVSSSGNVGIGTGSDIVSTNLVGAVTIKKSYSGDSTNGATTQAYYANQSALFLFGRNSGVSIISNNNEEGSIIFGNASTNAYASIITGTAANTVGGDMYFKVGSNTERMRITTAGLVGIGTASPSNLLSVVQSNSAASTTVDITNSSNASTTTKTAQLVFRISDTANDLKPAASIIAFPDGVNNISAGMYFSTRASDGGPFERMRITSGGNVLVGQSTADIGSNGWQLQAAGGGHTAFAINNNEAFIFNNRNSGTTYQIDFRTNSVERGAINVTDSGTSYATTSDYRVKEDFKDFNGLEKLTNIKVYDFKFKDLNERMDGVIAHELQEVLPYAVYGEKDGAKFQGVDYSRIVPVLIKAIQELKAENDTLKEILQRNNIQ